MGMVALFKVLEHSEYETIHGTPTVVEEILFPDYDEDDEDEEEFENPFEGQFDLEKSWHALHFIITGTSQPDGSVLGDVVLGGYEIGPDLGYGPARIIENDKVVQIYSELQAINFELAYKSIDRDSDLLTEIYLGLQFGEEEYDYLKESFDVLVSAYKTASDQAKSLLTYVA